MQKLKVLDLFSGIGGFSLGLERTGYFETVAFCEIEPFCQKVLRKHWPEVEIYDDVTNLKYRKNVDLVTAGFPCQDISFAGEGAGLTGERSGLFWYIIRTLCLVGRPRALLENVAALLNRGLGTVLGAMASFGYDAEWHCIPAGALNAAHERDRIWIIADPQGVERLHKSYASEITKRLPNHILDGPSRLGGSPTPAICRVDDGIPDRVYRTERLGNSVFTGIPELIGHAIARAEGLTG